MHFCVSKAILNSIRNLTGKNEHFSYMVAYAYTKQNHEVQK